MRFLHRPCGLSGGLLLWILFTVWFQFGDADDTSSPWPILDNGLQHTVQWDHHSLLINGERLFLFGGEMHPFRLPVPELWEDMLQKIKATGMRMVSIYTHWGFHAPTPDKIDLSTGAHNLTRFLEMARDIGLYVMVRPGPYINGELSAGGMPLWTTTGEYGALRSNGTAYTKAWTPYQDGIARATKPFQLTEDGTVIMYQIEIEYAKQWKDTEAKIPNPEAISYMEKLKDNARKNGIVVPLMHNIPNHGKPSWSKDYDTVGAGGNVDIYGLDSYPQCWSCLLEACGDVTPWAVSDYFGQFQLASPKQPSFMPEFQAGAMNPWDGPAGGCKERMGVEFVNFYYRDNIAQGVTVLNLYMMYGGTNWGWLAAPIVGSSYDYAAAISEDRSIGDKFYEIKNFGLFTRVADELAFTDRVGMGTEYTNNTNLFTTELRNPKTGAGFYVIRHAQTDSVSEEWFAIQVNTSIGQFWMPKISSALVMSGHERRILVTDFHFGNNTLYYATPEVLAHSIIDGKSILVLWTPLGRNAEFYLQGATNGTFSGGQAVTFSKSEKGVIVGYTQKEGMSVLDFDNDVRVVIMDRKTAYKAWAPALTNDPKVPVDQTALVIGPYLVRSATLNANTISIQGDANTTNPLEVFTASHITQIQWKGIDLPTTKTNHSTLAATIPGPSPSSSSFPAPQITNWKSHDSLPERLPSYSDAGPAWVLANDSTTPNPALDPNTTTKPYLFADQYGFHTGIRLWRGHFSADKAPTGVFLHVQGGTAHGWSAYLNGAFLGSWLGRSDVAAANLTFSFGEGMVTEGEENVLLVVHDDTGHDQQAGAVRPRGILNATLLGEGGGLTAERLGWHLPGFDDSAWEAAEGGPREGFEGAGVRFYRGTMALDVPPGVDVSLAFRFTPVKGGEGYRVLLFVNGWQYGRYYPSIAAEDTFPVPVGVLDYGGENVVGLAVWALQADGAQVDVEVVVRYVVDSSLDVRFDGSYLRPGWDPLRLEYV
ncbi:glycoside hydrolase superfamily [Chaetomidium leptoderma]|uniref:beta-galactosidase n=1 Tax=Chaetomidium leptoderma TaxID=669021 RepID=A0AAN6VG35_9PEZI|nr:glycoside hydrolase superfamily [Chaetomidium leptoderma]